MAADLATSDPPPSSNTLAHLSLGNKDNEVLGFKANGTPITTFSTSHRCGTQPYAPNHVAKNFFQCTAATSHHDSNHLALLLTAQYPTFASYAPNMHPSSNETSGLPHNEDATKKHSQPYPQK